MNCKVRVALTASCYFLAASTEDEFEKWQKEIQEAEAEAERLKNGAVEDDQDRPSSPPEGEDEFTDDDGTRYKWDKALRAWAPQVILFI